MTILQLIAMDYYGNFVKDTGISSNSSINALISLCDDSEKYLSIVSGEESLNV